MPTHTPAWQAQQAQQAQQRGEQRGAGMVQPGDNATKCGGGGWKGGGARCEVGGKGGDAGEFVESVWESLQARAPGAAAAGTRVQATQSALGGRKYCAQPWAGQTNDSRWAASVAKCGAVQGSPAQNPAGCRSNR